MKKWLMVLSILLSMLSVSVYSVACNGEDSSNWEESSYTESSSEDPFHSDPEDTRLYLTVCVKSEEGEVFSGVKLRVTSGTETVKMMTTDGDGRATCRLEKGIYTVRLSSGLPSHYYATFYTQEAILHENITLTFILIDDNES